MPFKPIVHLEHKFFDRNFLLAALPVDHVFDMKRVRLFPSDKLNETYEVGRYIVSDSVLTLRQKVESGLVYVTSVTGGDHTGPLWRASIEHPYRESSYEKYRFAYDLEGLTLLIRDNIPFDESKVRFVDLSDESTVRLDASGFVSRPFPNCIVADNPAGLRSMVLGRIRAPVCTNVVYNPDEYEPFQGISYFSSPDLEKGHVAYLVSDFRDECTLVYKIPQYTNQD